MNRRDFLRKSGGAAGAALIAPLVAALPAAPPPLTADAVLAAKQALGDQYVKGADVFYQLGKDAYGDPVWAPLDGPNARERFIDMMMKPDLRLQGIFVEDDDAAKAS